MEMSITWDNPHLNGNRTKEFCFPYVHNAWWDYTMYGLRRLLGSPADAWEVYNHEDFNTVFVGVLAACKRYVERALKAEERAMTRAV